MLDLNELPNFIQQCYADHTFMQQHKAQALNAVNTTLSHLDNGTIQVVQSIDGEWQLNTWIKEAILLSFKLYSSTIQPAAYTNFFDKFPSKFKHWNEEKFQAHNIRVIQPATARFGCYIGNNSILMNCFVNIGAYVDSGTMIDTFALVGSCARIGKNVHISGGAGIGGVLEPLQSKPCIIEDNCFIGAGSWITEGVIVEENSIIGTGVHLSNSTKIFNRITQEVTYGRVPKGSVIVPGSIPDSTGTCNVNCAIITKQIDSNTRKKVSINELLRDKI